MIVIPAIDLMNGQCVRLFQGKREAVTTYSNDPGSIANLTAHLREGVKRRFAQTLEKKRHADESVEAGREYVESYVQYTHYVEGIEAAAGAAHSHRGSETAGPHNPVE